MPKFHPIDTALDRSAPMEGRPPAEESEAPRGRRGGRLPQAAVLAVAIAVFGFGVASLAHVMDFFGPPPPGDPSEFTGPLIGENEAIDDLENEPDANLGAFEGGATGTSEDPGENNFLGENEVNSGRQFDVPTGGPLSPLFGAGEFEQQMLRFEEFGTDRLANAPALTTPFPQPTTGPAPEQDPIDEAASGPSGASLEAFLNDPGITPFPTVFANDVDSNPWQSEIETFLGRALVTPPAEGRPPGQGWAHQRWNEFSPEVFYNTTVSGGLVHFYLSFYYLPVCWYLIPSLKQNQIINHNVVYRNIYDLSISENLALYSRGFFLKFLKG
jgi:hypothetical protein